MSIQVSVLSNGLRVASDSMQEAESVVFGVWVGVGTRHEPWKANGVAHLTEHMMFKGTKKRSAYALSSAIENRGGMMNAHTTREETAYYARVLPEDVELAADIVSDMLQKSLYAPKELERERKVVLQEIGRDIDTPEDHIWDLFHETAYPDQRLGRSILGASKVVGKLPRSEIVDYVQKYYHAGNMVVIASGRIEHAEAVRLAETYFGKVKKGREAPFDPACFQGGDFRQEKDAEQLHLMMGFKAPGVKSKASASALLLSFILGGNASSRLFQKVREKRGLVYAISANHIAFRDTGLLAIYAGTDPQRAKELMPVVCRELVDVTQNVTPSELKRAKAQARADLLIGRESVMGRAELLGQQMLVYGKPIPVEKTLHRLEEVTRETVQSLASKMLSSKPVLTALGMHDEIEAYTKIREQLALS